MVTVLILGTVGMGSEKHDFPSINSARDVFLAATVYIIMYCTLLFKVLIGDYSIIFHHVCLREKVKFGSTKTYEYCNMIFYKENTNKTL